MGGAVTRQLRDHCAGHVGMLFKRPAAEAFWRAPDGYRSVTDVVVERPAKFWNKSEITMLISISKE